MAGLKLYLINRDGMNNTNLLIGNELLAGNFWVMCHAVSAHRLDESNYLSIIAVQLLE